MPSRRWYKTRLENEARISKPTRHHLLGRDAKGKVKLSLYKKTDIFLTTPTGVGTEYWSYTMNIKSAALSGLKPRQKNGELKRKRKTSKKSKSISNSKETAVVLRQRLKYIDARYIEKPEAGHLLGCLFLNGYLEHRQYIAAQTAAVHYARFRLMKGLPRATIQIVDLNAIFGVGNQEIDPEKLQAAKEHIGDIEYIILQYKDSQNKHKGKVYPSRSLELFQNIIERDEIPPNNWKQFSWTPNYQIINGILNELADLYKIKNPT